MKISDEVRFALSAIRTRKSRSALTIIGIVIGIAAITAMISLGNGFQSSVTTQLSEGTGSDVVAISGGSGRFFQNTNVTFNTTDAAGLMQQNIPGLELAVPIIQQTGWVLNADNTSNSQVTVVGVDFSNYTALYPTTFVNSSGIIPTDPTSQSWVVGSVITADFPVNTQLTFHWNYLNTTTNTTVVNNYTTQVAGALPQIGGSFAGAGGFGGAGGFTSFSGAGSGPSDRAIYLPFQEAEALFDPTHTGVVSSIVLLLTNSSSATYTSVGAGVSVYFQFNGNREASINQPFSLTDTLSNTFNTVDIFLTGIAGISLIVAGIGIMNIMLVSLMERTREIGILKAHGASNRDILTTFLVEVSIFGFLGGAIGLLAGYSVAALFGGNILSGMLGMSGRMMVGGMGGNALVITPIITWQLALEAIGFGLLISLLFGLYPAWRASRLRPVESLRSE